MALTTDSAARKDKRTAHDAPTLEHRHFAFIATTIRDMDNLANGHTDLAKIWQRRIAEHFADNCARTNPRFDRARFLRACGC